jgi:hypothetical protein
MAASQRVSRGFHRLGLVLGVIALLVGGGLSVTTARHQTNSMQKLLLCAQTAFKDAPPDDAIIDPPLPPGAPPPPPGSHSITAQLDLQKLGCSESPQTIAWGEVFKLQSYASNFVTFLGPKVALTLALSLAVYYMVRALGWVIGGFAAT